MPMPKRVPFGQALRHRGDYAGALAEAERALTTTPNLASAHGVLASVLLFSGRPRDGLAAVRRCIRLDPRDPALASRLNYMAIGLYFSCEYEAAVEVSKRTIRSYPEFPLPYRWLAAALGQSWSRPSRLRRPRSICMSANACRGCGPKTMLTCLRACGKPGGGTSRQP